MYTKKVYTEEEFQTLKQFLENIILEKDEEIKKLKKELEKVLKLYLESL